MKAALQNYQGEKTGEALFDAVLAPIAAEYGITASFEEFRAYQDQLANDDEALSDDEVAQVAGGDGFGTGACYFIGVGLGIQQGNLCILVGCGIGYAACMEKGSGKIDV